MTKEFKRTFFSSSIAVLLIMSNIIGLKYTTFASFVLPISFITYPLISLCVIMLVDLYGRKTAMQAVYTALILQLFMLLSQSNTCPDINSDTNFLCEGNGKYVLVPLSK